MKQAFALALVALTTIFLAAPAGAAEVQRVDYGVVVTPDKGARVRVLVYGPGRYRFADFLKVGSILTILIYVVAILLTPRVWPLR